MHSRLKKLEMNKAFFQSLFIHFLLLVFFFMMIKLDQRKIMESFQFRIEEKEVVVINIKPRVLINAASQEMKAATEGEKPREVFGVKRKTLTSENGTVEAKIGNTLTKAQDNEVLLEAESDSLPQPAEEFLITTMPRPLKEVRPDYPIWAKEQKIAGSVIFDILIDKEGKVREALLLRGLHPELDNIAKKAIFQFEFQPAYIEKEATAVRIKYAIKFVLES